MPRYIDAFAVLGFALWASSALADFASARPHDSAGATQGVVVEEARIEWPGHRAGVREGDVLQHWTAVGAGGIVESSGTLTDPWDFLALAHGTALVADVRIRGRRIQSTYWTLPSAEWGLAVRPALSSEHRQRHASALSASKSKDTGQACESWTALSRHQASAKNPRNSAWFLWRCAQALAAAGDWSNADIHFDMVRAALRESGAHIVILAATLEWANLAYSADQIPIARDAVAEAMSAAELNSPSFTAQRLALSAAAIRIARRSGQDQEAATRGRLLAAEARTLIPGTTLEASILSDLSFTLLRMGELPEAHIAASSAVAYHAARQGAYDEARRTRAGFAQILQSQGNFKAAEREFRAALEVAERLDPEGASVATILTNLGRQLTMSGQQIQAEAAAKRALSIHSRRSPNSVHAANAAALMAAIAMERADYTEAAEWIEKARNTTGTHGRSTEKASYFGLTGAIEERRGNLSAAADWYRRSAALWSELAPKNLRHSWAVQGLGLIEQRRGNLDAAIAHLRQAKDLRDATAPLGAETAEGDVALADALVEAKRFEDSEQLLIAAKEVLELQSPDSVSLAVAHYDLGRIALSAGRNDEAHSQFCAAVDVLERQRRVMSFSSERRTRFAAGYRRIYEACRTAHLRRGDTPSAWLVVERSRARSLLEILSENVVPLDREVGEADQTELAELSTKLSDAYARLSKATEKERLQSEIASLRARREESISRIKEHSPRYGALRFPEALTLDRANEAIPDNAAGLVYSIGIEASYLFVLRSGHPAQVVELDISEREVRELVEGIRTAIATKLDGPTLSETLSFAYRKLVQPAEAFIPPSAELIIAPDIELNLLPFAALIDASGNYLVERHAHSIVASISVYAGLIEPGAEQAPASVLAVADSNIPAGLQAMNLRPLPNAREEAVAVAKQFEPRARVLVGNEASETKIRDLVRDASVVHFAIHAYFDAEAPLNSGLVLSPSDEDDGVAHVWEIIDSWKISSDLVALSACETGLGEQIASEGVLGLTRAFQFAGARTVLNTLWPVADRSSLALMTAFYPRRGKASDREALRHAQLDLIRDGTQGDTTLRGVGGIRPTDATSSAHPFYWAGVVLNGSAN